MVRWIALLTVLIASMAIADENAVSFEGEVKPIFREHCLGCHNADKRKGGLALDTYAATLEGGSSGEVVYEGDSDSSRLFQLVNHDDSPEMPPQQDRIADAKIDMIRRWIDEGLAERSGTAIKAKKKVGLTFQPVDSVDTPGAMPEGLSQQPIMVTPRSAAVAALATSPRAPLIAVGGQNQVALYHTSSTELLGIIPFPEGNPFVLRFSRDASLLLVGGGRGAACGHVALHDVATGERLILIGDELDTVLAADIDRSLSRVVLGGPSKVAKIFDARTGDELFKITKHTDWITAAEFSPDGKFLATADRAGGLILWEAATAREYQVFEGHKSSIANISWRADSKAFVTGAEEGNVRLWDPEKVKPIRNFGHGGGVTTVQMANDGAIISGGRNQHMKRWDGNGKELMAYEKMPDLVTQVAITHDRGRVFAGDWSGRLWIYDVEDKEHNSELSTTPPTLESRLAKAQSEYDTVNAAVAAAANELRQHQVTLTQATKEYVAAVEQVALAEDQARSVSRRIYELVRRRDNDSVPDDSEARKRIAAEQNDWNRYLQASVAAYNQLIDRLGKLKAARTSVSIAKAKVADEEKRLLLPQTRVQEIASLIELGQRSAESTTVQ